MTKTEIKKALYKEKPIARSIHSNKLNKFYHCYLQNDNRINFKVPYSDMGINIFDDEIPAQLLIRWIV